MNAAIDLYVFVERGVFETDAAWLKALERLAGLDVEGLAVQVRTRGETEERSLELARAARDATRGARAVVLLNGSTQRAWELGYEGVHWPEALLANERTRPGLICGASVHSPEAALRAESAGADFLVAGTVFDAGSKPVRGTGLEALRAIAGSTRLPVLAIGGVTAERVAACREAGAAGVAVVTAVVKAADMAGAVNELRVALDAAKAGVGSS